MFFALNFITFCYFLWVLWFCEYLSISVTLATFEQRSLWKSTIVQDKTVQLPVGHPVQNPSNLISFCNVHHSCSVTDCVHIFRGTAYPTLPQWGKSLTIRQTGIQSHQCGLMFQYLFSYFLPNSAFPSLSLSLSLSFSHSFFQSVSFSPIALSLYPISVLTQFKDVSIRTGNNSSLDLTRFCIWHACELIFGEVHYISHAYFSDHSSHSIHNAK